ncbi:MAG: hypothetical protein QOD80_343 [Verrucomicrobiota bacterium]
MCPMPDLRFWAAAFLLMTTQFAFAKTATEMNADAGIEGVIMAGPTRGGPSRPGMSDTRPLAKTAFVVNKDDREVASFTTDDHGKFHVSLAPGHYVVATRERIGKLGNYGPFEVDLVAGQIKKVQWMCDTGMR